MIRTTSLLVAGLAVVSAARGQSLPAPIHYYPFVSDASDAVGGADGTLLHGAAVVDGRLVLDGVDDYVQIDRKVVPVSGSYSVALIVQQESPQAGHREFISQGVSEGPGFYIGHDPSKNVRVTDSWQQTGVPYPQDGASHHVAVIVDAVAGVTDLYVDGQLQASRPAAISTSSDGNDTRLGRQYDPAEEHLAGSIDEVRIYDVALTASEVAVLAGLCYADCDASGALDFFDFLCFQNAFATGDPYADCDGTGVLDFFDFLCFQNAFAAGCP